MKKIKLRYFAKVREDLGKAEEMYETASENVTQLRVELSQRDTLHQQTLLANNALRIAVNHVMVDEPVVINDGDEVAFFPPVTGG